MKCKSNGSSIFASVCKSKLFQNSKFTKKKINVGIESPGGKQFYLVRFPYKPQNYFDIKIVFLKKLLRWQN